MSTDAPDRTLVAGIGNVFLGDDGFGVEAVNRLARAWDPLPPGVELVDAGVRGMHLAYRLLDGYRRLVLLDATARGEAPGTLTVLEVDPAAPEDAQPGPPDPHALDPAAVLRLLHGLRAAAGGTLPERVWVVGCEPEDTGEGMGLSRSVEAALDPATRVVRELLKGDSDEADDDRRGGDGRAGPDVRGGPEPAGPAALPADAPDVRRR